MKVQSAKKVYIGGGGNVIESHKTQRIRKSDPSRIRKYSREREQHVQRPHSSKELVFNELKDGPLEKERRKRERKGEKEREGVEREDARGGEIAGRPMNIVSSVKEECGSQVSSSSSVHHVF